MIDIAIVCLHHKRDSVTVANVESFRRNNPEVPIIMVSVGQEIPPDGYSAARCGEMGKWWFEVTNYERKKVWANTDLGIYSWYLSKREDAQRWMFIEWDTWCEDTPVRDFFKRTWDMDFVVTSSKFPNRDQEWVWFKEIGLLPSDIQRYAAGMVSTSCIMISDRALCDVSNYMLTNKIMCFSDLRLPTLLNYCGYPPHANPEAGPSLTWREILGGTKITKGLWHAVKHPIVGGILQGA